jgi:hypothetical protein
MWKCEKRDECENQQSANHTSEIKDYVQELFQNSLEKPGEE